MFVPKSVFRAFTLWNIFFICLIFSWTGHAFGQAPVKIGMSLGLTGQYAEMAQTMKKAFLLWENHVNEDGGLLNRPVDLVIYDDRGSPDRARDLYRELIEKDRVDHLFGPYSSELTKAVLPLTAKYGYPLLACGATSDSLWELGYRNIFGVFTPSSRYTLGFIEMLTVHGIGKIALVAANDPFSRDVAKGAAQLAGLFGQNVVFYEIFQDGTANLQNIAFGVRESGAEALIVCGHFNEAVNMRNALDAIGWEPEAFYASIGPVFDSYYEMTKGRGESTFTSSQWEYLPTLPYPGSKRFYDSYVGTYGSEPVYHAAVAYACGEILKKAIEKAGSLERERVMEKLSTMDTISPIGRYSVDRSGKQERQFTLIMQWQNGKKEIVWPRELSTSRPVFK